MATRAPSSCPPPWTTCSATTPPPGWSRTGSTRRSRSATCWTRPPPSSCGGPTRGRCERSRSGCSKRSTGGCGRPRANMCSNGYAPSTSSWRAISRSVRTGTHERAGSEPVWMWRRPDRWRRARTGRRAEHGGGGFVSRSPFPFSALVGQRDLVLALLLNAVSPAVGGVLVRGEKGTAKSTAVRGLSRLLPQIQVVDGCPFNCDPAAPDPDCPAAPHPHGAPRRHRPAPLVELPVGASTDRVAGSLDLERALTEGRRGFEPGLLAAAHRGVLYVDEVNLLGDHLVDLLLDAAALGVNYVEREGVSARHAARFLLVGTMNPEEGELRPQLLDRFGVTVEVRGNADPAERVEVIRRRLAYEADPDEFAAAWAAQDAALTERIVAARRRLPSVRLDDELLQRIAAVCAAFAVDGLRGDIVTAKAALALAAWEGRDAVGL